jgi:hypothetical protein
VANLDDSETLGLALVAVDVEAVSESSSEDSDSDGSTSSSDSDDSSAPARSALRGPVGPLLHPIAYWDHIECTVCAEPRCGQVKHLAGEGRRDKFIVRVYAEVDGVWSVSAVGPTVRNRNVASHDGDAAACRQWCVETWIPMNRNCCARVFPPPTLCRRFALSIILLNSQHSINIT